MKDEFNEFTITNDNVPKNVLSNTTATNAGASTETSLSNAKTYGAQSVDEISESSGNGSGASAGNGSGASALKAKTLNLNFNLATTVVAVVATVTVVASVAEIGSADYVEPSAPVAAVSYLGVEEYTADGDLAIEFILEDTAEELATISVWVEDYSGAQYLCELTSVDETYTATVNLSAADLENDLTLVIYAETYANWTGVLYRDIITLPSAPVAEVMELYVAQYTQDNDLTIEFILEDTAEELATISVWVEDYNGAQYLCELTSVEDTYTATVNLSEADLENALSLVIYAETYANWTGELYRDTITLPDVPVAEIMELYVAQYTQDYDLTFEFILEDTAEELATITVWIEDYNGAQYPCELIVDGNCTATVNLAEADLENDLTLVIYAETYANWTGELYRDTITLPSSPVAEIMELYVAQYTQDYDLTFEFILEDTAEEFATISVWVEDYGGLQYLCELVNIDEAYTATVNLAEADLENDLTLVIYAETYANWTGELYRSEITLPTAPEITVSDAYIDGSFTEGVGGVAYVGFVYDGDRTNVSAYEYRLEDENGQTYACTVREETGDELIVYASFSAEDAPAFDVYGRLYFVISVQTADGWTGEIYREKFVVTTDGYTAYPYFYDSEMTLIYYENSYVYINFYVYDPDLIWSNITITITDANGAVYTSVLDDSNDYYGYEADDYGAWYYVEMEDSSALAVSESSTVQLTISVTWNEPDGSGGYLEAYEEVIYDAETSISVELG